MRDLQPSDHGRRFSAFVMGSLIEGKLNMVEKGEIIDGFIICQDVFNGFNVKEKFGYKYSYWLPNKNYLQNFKFINMTAKEIEEYKDFKKGDVLRRSDRTLIVVEELGEVLFLKDKYSGIETLTAERLYASGWRFDVIPEEEEKPVVELSVAEIAKKLGLSPEQLKVVDK